MTLALRDCTFAGPALPAPFVKFELERQLAKLSPIPKAVGQEARALQGQWDTYRSKLRSLGDSGGDLRVLNHVIEPLAPLLGYAEPRREEKVRTREGDEDGGWWLPASDQVAGLRAWTVALGVDLDAPNRRGRAYRFSPARVAARVLLAKGERAGLLTDGQELRLLLCDPARPDSHVAIALDRSGGWRGAREVPDSLRLLVALGRPAGVAVLPELVEAARLSQTTVTRKLREQARNAVRDFVQGVLDEPRNAAKLDSPHLAKTLWEEGLILIYRLLFILKMESSSDPSRAFSFAATSLWRNSYSPNTALAPAVGAALAGVDTGGFLEYSLRTLFRLFSEGLESAELKVSPLGGALFGSRTTPVLDDLVWGERAVAHLLDALLWTPGEKKAERERVHYGSLDVEDLGRVYEALLELEPGITTEPMCRLRRTKLEVVVPVAQGAPYRTIIGADAETDEEPEQDDEDEESSKKGKGKTKVAWVEDIPAGRFFLRTGLGRKSSGSYYTPHAFVRFLVQETLGPQVAEHSPSSDPQPLRILKLKVLDPAMGSGHFLVEACRFLGDALYEACRLCDERATAANESGDHALAAEFRQRVAELPDPNDELLEWLPSRAPEGSAGGLSQQRALSLCRRLVAVHCLYGVDKNRLAVELAKLSLWLESYAEGLPLTFLDHRLVCGDSLTGPLFEHLFTWPKAGGPIGDDLFTRGLHERLSAALGRALEGVRDLTASVGKDVADLERKATAKARLDGALEPFRTLAAAWAGAVMLSDDRGDYAYLRAAKAVVEGTEVPDDHELTRMIEIGGSGVVYDLAFPEVFHQDGQPERSGGFHAVVGNPPWDAIQPYAKEFFATFDLQVLEAVTKRERIEAQARLESDAVIAQLYHRYAEAVKQSKQAVARKYQHVGIQADGRPSGAVIDLWQAFAEAATELTTRRGRIGLVLPASFHSNQSATGIRKLYLQAGRIDYYFSFENRRLLFEAHPQLKFSLVVASPNESPTVSFPCTFYAHETGWLFEQREIPRYTVQFVRATGGDHLTFLELRSPMDGAVAQRLYKPSLPAAKTFEAMGLECGVGLDMTKASHLFVDASEHLSDDQDPRLPTTAAMLFQSGLLPLHEGKTFHQYTDAWPEASIRYLVRTDTTLGHTRTAGFIRLAIREVTNSENERTAIAALLPPSFAANTVVVEKAPEAVPSAHRLLVVAVLNSFSLDWASRLRVTRHLNKYILEALPFPRIVSGSCRRYLVHSALRLSCNHEGYTSLWLEQFGDVWRERTLKHSWPVLAGDDARWIVRAAIDAVVANAYGLSREQYTHVLNSFSHKSYLPAPDLCLAAFDELHSVGLDAFVSKHDPYDDVPLNGALPKPVIHFGSISTSAPVGELFEEPR